MNIKKMNMLCKRSVILVTLYLFACGSVQKSAFTDKSYPGNVVENPLFNGKPAEEGFCEYVADNTIYWVEAMEKGITGHVFVEFFVEKNGSVGNVKVVGAADPVLEAEALRVVNSSPDWTPKKIDGEPVRMSYILPFNFRLITLQEYYAEKQATNENQTDSDQSHSDSTSLLKTVELSEEPYLLKEVVILGVGVTRRTT